MCDHFIRQNPLDIIGVHCTHGFNRTGFLIISYLVDKRDWSIDAAINKYAEARPPGIYKEDYLEELFNRYGDMDEMPAPPALPDWCSESDDRDDDGRSLRDTSGTSAGIVRNGRVSQLLDSNGWPDE